MQLHTTPLVLILFATACEPSPYPDDVDALAARWAASHGDFVERCITPHTLRGAFGRAAEPTLAATAPAPDSRLELEVQFRQLFLVPDRELDRDAFERCLAAQDALPACPVDPDTFLERAGCTQLFVGAREEGDACVTDAVCGPGLFCDAPELSCGRCAPDVSALLAPFRPCDDDPMCGLFASPTEVGAACELNCGSGRYAALACVDGQCVQRRVIDLGGVCDSFVEAPFGPPSLRHCRDEDFGSTSCQLVDGGAPTCVFVPPADRPGVFIPGAPVVSAGGDGGVAGFRVECAP